MILDYHKVEAQGNNYIYFDFLMSSPPDIDFSSLARFVSDVNRGIGSDGMVLLCKDIQNQVLMRMWNRDGSEAEICGSALRSVTALLARKSFYTQSCFQIATKAGLVTGKLIDRSTHTVSINLNVTDTAKPAHSITQKTISINVNGWQGKPIDVGNPHFVIFRHQQADAKKNFDLSILRNEALIIEQASSFPNRTNIEFTEILAFNKAKVIVWERGSGFTQACGTGAIAVVLAGMELGLLSADTTITFPGGELTVQIDQKDNKYCLTGSVNIVSWGEINYSHKESACYE